MARGLFASQPGISRALIVGPGEPDDGPARAVEWIDSPHPQPDARSEHAGRRALALASGLPADGLLLVLLSGGASSMLAVPADGVSLADKAATSHELMKAGVPIAELNCVRKHLSAIKGGRLAAAARWRTLTLALSDVHAPVADDPGVIASGPTAPDPTTFRDALDVVDRAEVWLPGAVRRRLEAGARGELAETPKPGDSMVAGARYVVVGNRHTAMEGASAEASRLGYEVCLVDPPTFGEARDEGNQFARRALGHERTGRVCVIASGETVVTVKGTGKGGRNQEFVLGAVRALEALASAGIAAALGSVGTDGIDGPTDAAGAVADAWSALRVREAGLDIEDALRRNDAHRVLHALEDLITWGPTGTNAGDLHVLVMESGRQS
ncbi:glycerate kinase [soil metagenome]